MFRSYSFVIMSMAALSACATGRKPSSTGDKGDKLEAWRALAPATLASSRIDAQTLSLLNPFYSANTFSFTIGTDSSRDLSIGPFIFFDLQMPKIVRSLESLESEPRLGVRTLADAPDPTQLEVSSDDEPFRVVIRNQFLGGAGAAMSVGAGDVGGGAYFSLAPIVGRYRVSTRLAHNRAHAATMKGLAVPRTAADLVAWQVGDKLDWASSGGVVFRAGPSYWGLFAGAQYLAQGNWGSSVEKLADSRYLVQIVKGNVQSLSLVANTQLVTVVPGLFRDSDSHFSFLVDVSDVAAKSALEAYFKGNLTPMQKLAEDPSVAAVTPYETSRTLSKGRMLALNVGIPFLSIRRGTGNIHSLTETLFNPDGAKGDVRYGIAMDVTSSRLFNKSSNYSLGFFGANYETTRADGSKSTGYFGQFGYNFDKNITTAKDLKEAIARIGRVTALVPEMAAKMPVGSRWDTNLGATSIDFLMTIGQEATDALMQVAASDDRVSEMVASAERDMMAYFGVPADNLTPHAGEFSNQPARVKFSDAYGICAGYVNCPPYMGNDTRAAIRKMVKNLRLMGQALGNNDRDAFVKAYAEFGEGMMATPFAFQAALAQIKQFQDVAAYYSISGERLKQHQVVFNWSRR